MSKGTVTAVVLLALAGGVAYALATGLTLTDAKNWVERQTGTRVDKPNLKGVPYTNYGPIVTPGQ